LWAPLPDRKIAAMPDLISGDNYENPSNLRFTIERVNFKGRQSQNLLHRCRRYADNPHGLCSWCCQVSKIRWWLRWQFQRRIQLSQHRGKLVQPKFERRDTSELEEKILFIFCRMSKSRFCLVLFTFVARLPIWSISPS
jgi:hypothetical protein